MEPLTILRADPLDLLFENRNKAYGAYPLRKYYAQRLMISLGIVISFLLILTFFYLWFRSQLVIRKIPDIPELTLTPFDPVQPVKPIAPPFRPSAPKPATVEFVTPVVVSDPPAGSVIASIEDLDNHAIGLQTTPGELGGDQLPGEGNESGSTVKAADSAENNPEILDHPELMPEFPGGPEALKRFLQRNLRMPENDLETGTQVKVIAHFVVGPDGRVRDVEITR